MFKQQSSIERKKRDAESALNDRWETDGEKCKGEKQNYIHNKKLTKASTSEVTGPAMTLLDNKQVETIKKNMTEEYEEDRLHILLVMMMKVEGWGEGWMKWNL